MSEFPLEVSVIVPCFDAARTLEGCLRSLIDQQAPFPYEVLVVENASRDDSLGIARSLERPGGPLRVLQEQKPGSYSARNRGIREARGRLLLFTDADCRARPGWLFHLASALKEPLVLLVGGEVVGACGQQELVARYARAKHVLSQTHTLRHPGGAFLQTANLGVRARHAREAGGFDAGLYSGGDADFCWRLRKLWPEGKIHLVPGAVVEHVHRVFVGEFYRQYFRYGQADVMLSKRHPVRWIHTLAKGLLDGLRLLCLPFFLLLGSVKALLSRDLLPLAAPCLRCLQILARRSGQIAALLRPGRLRRQ